MIRRNAFAALVAVSVFAALAAEQIAGSVALRAYAESSSWMQHVAPPAADALERFAVRYAVPQTLRLVLAREALRRGDIARSTSLAARLGPSNDRLALFGDVAERRGDLGSAVAAYLAAGDVSALEQHIAAAAARGDMETALRLQHETIARLAGDPTQRAALAAAQYELGLLREQSADRFAAGSTQRLADALRSERAYARAVELAPLEERYLVALGNQRLNLGDVAAAERTFERARDADPASAEPLTGLGDAALRRGNRRAALEYLARARTRDPNSAAVRRLAAQLGT